MEQIEDLRSERTALGVEWFLVTVILTLVDILCVSAYFGIILCLLYFTFLKDCLEIFIYANVKCIARVKWLCRILKIRELLYANTEPHGIESNISRTLQGSVSVLSNSCLVQNSPDPVASNGSSNSKTLDRILYSSKHSEKSLQSSVEEENRSSVIFESPETSKSESEESVPRKLSSLSTQVISSTENFNVDDTNFEDVDLSDRKGDKDLLTPTKECITERSSLKWNISKMRLLFRNESNNLSSPTNLKTKLENIAAKVSEVIPHRADDSEKLISNKDESPEKIGCCTSLPYFFKSKHQLSSITSYARF